MAAHPTQYEFPAEPLAGADEIHRTHVIELHDAGAATNPHAEVVYLDRGPDRDCWRARCLVCQHRGSAMPEVGAAVRAAFHHGLIGCTR